MCLDHIPQWDLLLNSLQTMMYRFACRSVQNFQHNWELSCRSIRSVAVLHSECQNDLNFWLENLAIEDMGASTTRPNRDIRIRPATSYLIEVRPLFVCWAGFVLLFFRVGGHQEWGSVAQAISNFLNRFFPTKSVWSPRDFLGGPPSKGSQIFSYE